MNCSDRLRAMGMLVALAGVTLSPAWCDWTAVHPTGAAPIRSIVRRADGRLLGPRSTGHSIEIWMSTTSGATWQLHGSVATNNSVNYGDPILLPIPGTSTVFCAFREMAADGYRVTVCRSDDNGDSWVFDSTVAGPVSRFVGAPFLFRRLNGDLQCYYDSEQLAADQGHSGFQWIAMQGRAGLTGAWDHYGLVTASRENNPAVLTRDGLATVVQLGGDRLMCVTEGVETQGHGGANVVRYIESGDGGVTWNYAARAIAYQCRIDPATNRQYNAYDPYAIRVGGGPVWVAFCTDEDDTGPPDFSSQPVDQRHAHAKYVATTDTFEHWSQPSVIWSAGANCYGIGLFERRPNDVLTTIDLLNGSQALFTNTAPFHLADALRSLTGAGGLTTVSPADASYTDVESSGTSAGRIDLMDTVDLVRKVVGLETNP